MNKATYDASAQSVLQMNGILSIACMLVLAFIMPIHSFVFVFKRQSNDLYFGLPLKRSSLYMLQYGLGAVIALLPLYVNFILNTIIYSVFFPASFPDLVSFYAVLLLLFFCLYSLITFLVVRCNTLLDAVLIAGAYIVLPLFLYIAASIYLDGQGGAVFIADVSVINELVNVQVAAGIVSLPAVALYLSVYFLTGVGQIPAVSQSAEVMLVLYWMLIGAFCFWRGKKAFEKRREEDAQQRTTALCTYPFIINVITFCLLLIACSFGIRSLAMFTMLIVVIILYCVMKMFARRTFRLVKKEALFFVALFICTMIFSFAFRETKGFGRLQEVPDQKQIGYVMIDLNTNSTILPEDADTNDQGGDGSSLSYVIKQPKNIADIVDIQEEIMKYEKKGRMSNWQGNVSITYHLKDGRVLVRNYDLTNREADDVISSFVILYQHASVKGT